MQTLSILIDLLIVLVLIIAAVIGIRVLRSMYRPAPAEFAWLCPEGCKLYHKGHTSDDIPSHDAYYAHILNCPACKGNRQRLEREAVHAIYHS